MKEEFKSNDVVVITNSEDDWMVEKNQKDAFSQLGLVVGVGKYIWVLHGFNDYEPANVYLYDPRCITKVGVL